MIVVALHESFEDVFDFWVDRNFVVVTVTISKSLDVVSESCYTYGIVERGHIIVAVRRVAMDYTSRIVSLRQTLSLPIIRAADE